VSREGGKGAGRSLGARTLLRIGAPGLAELLSGRRWAGGAALAAWGVFWLLLVWRWDRVAGALGGPLDHRIALGTLLALGGGALTWSLRGLRQKVPGRAVPAWDPDREGPWSSAFRSFRGNRVAMAGLVVVAALHLVALLAPFLAPYDPGAQGDLLTLRLTAPSTRHLLGTDPFARDILSRLIYGARVSLSIAILAVAIAVSLGTLLGAVAGYVGGILDSSIMRGVDVALAFPRLVLLIAVMALFQPSPTLVVLVLGLTQWPPVTRIVRGEILSLREREFILAGRALGFSRGRIIFRHLVPNALAPIIVAATLGVGDTIVLEAVLSFLGLGIQEPVASWGRMVSSGREHMLGAWWVATFPGVTIVLAVMAFNLAGDGLRDALDPRLRS
jgi:peptide/nickel transport system permease protein